MPLLSTALLKTLGASGLTNVGSFASEAALNAAWPNPQDGLFASVGIDGTSGDEGIFLSDGNAWNAVSGGGGGGGIPEAPEDGTGYVRKDGDWSAESGGDAWEYKTADFTAEAGKRYVVSGTINVTEPASAVAGDSFYIQQTLDVANAVNIGAISFNGGGEIFAHYDGASWSYSETPALSGSTFVTGQMFYRDVNGNLFPLNPSVEGDLLKSGGPDAAPLFGAGPERFNVSDFTAVSGGMYVTGGTVVVTDPATPAAGEFYSVKVGTDSATIGGDSYSDGAHVFSIYDGADWLRYDYGASSGGAPGGTNGALQYNSSGSFAGAVITGLVKGNGTSAPSAASAGTDYITPSGSGESISNKTIGSSNVIVGRSDQFSIADSVNQLKSAFFNVSALTPSSAKTVSVPDRNLTLDTVSTNTDTAISGLLKGTGTKVAAASAGTDYIAPSGGSFSGAVNNAKGSDIASATTTDIGAATGNSVDVTGTTTITGLGTVQAGTQRVVRFTGALTLTHNATSLILPTSANITTAAGDTATFISLGSGNWVCTQYQRKDGTALASSGGSTDYSVRLTKSAAQSIGTIRTALTFDQEDFDTDTMHDNSTNNTRITFTHAGKYMVGGIVCTNANAVAGAAIRLNGGNEIAFVAMGNAGQDVNGGAIVQTIYSFAANDYVELWGQLGSTQNVRAGVDGCQFWAYKIA
jgi:hypothetical protein